MCVYGGRKNSQRKKNFWNTKGNEPSPGKKKAEKPSDNTLETENGYSNNDN